MSDYLKEHHITMQPLDKIKQTVRQGVLFPFDLSIYSAKLKKICARQLVIFTLVNGKEL